MTRYKAILFDLDGTLLDTTDLILASFQYTAKKHLGRSLNREDVLPSFGQPLIEGLEKIAPGKGQELIITYREHNLKHHDDMVKIFPWVKEVLTELRGMGLKLGIVTSKAKATALRGLRLFNLESFFEAIIALEDTTIHKPNPDPVILAMNRLMVSPKQCLMVGDSPHDLLSGQKAGTDTAAVKWSNLPLQSLLDVDPTYVLENMKDLLEIVRSR